MRLVKQNEGQELIEYALLASFIALSILIALNSIGLQVSGTFDRVATSLVNAIGGNPPGNSGNPPGNGGNPPGNSGNPPGNSGNPPGNGGRPPGQQH
jgi:Flp pilus assembly pilin Flp